MIIFDFDGTIADSLETVCEIYNELAPAYDLVPIGPENLPVLRELGIRKLLKRLALKPRHLPHVLNQGRKMLRERIEEIKPVPGILEQIESLHQSPRPLGILTSNSSENVEVFLNQFGIRKHFDFISTCPKLRGKAKHLSAIARTYSLSPLNMIYIGDEVRDIKAAKRAAVSVAAVTWGFNTKEALSKHEPDWLISTPDELAKLMTT